MNYNELISEFLKLEKTRYLLKVDLFLMSCATVAERRESWSEKQFW
ncbi:hypothetical protein HKBW3S33_01961 [Candidatus Hakubella thermalkaliphila]|uniref:Uncharacterized protein n=1 Tax=Candidatus Hakubella thermalkaliphila TaxID=2754717 RepID=A0A6V8P896_9ACTN|nr:hypothetical protein HKBW3S33_01961 [Candidatus Hakubella thermalkaliphila]